MTRSAQQVLDDALELSDEERAELAYSLLRTLDGEDAEEAEEEVARAWNETALKRAEDLLEGRVKAIPWEEAEAELRDRLAKRRGK